MPSRHRAGALLLLIGLWLVACQAQPAPVPPTPTADAAPRPAPPATASPTPAAAETPVAALATPPLVTSVSARPPVVVGSLAAPEAVAWWTTGDPDPLAYMLGQQLHHALLDPLTGEPQLAAAWELEDRRATFTLRDDATWSDGTPLRAADVADLLLQARAAGELPGIEGARARGERVLEVTLESPACPALMRVGSWPLVDVREWPPVRTSSGATVRESDEGWLIEPADVELRLFDDEVALRDAWVSGEVDRVLGASRLTTGPLPDAERDVSWVGPLLATLLFRLDAPTVEDARVREALTLATDRAALFESAYGAEPAALLTALLPPDHWAAPAAALPHDADRAADLLARAGWRDRDGDGVRENAAGTPLRLTLTLPLSRDVAWERLGHALADQWARLGVELALQYVEPYPLQERLHSGRWEVALVAYHVSTDPDQRALWQPPTPTDMVGQDLNVTGYRTAAVGELMTQGAQVAGCALADRARFYGEAWSLLLSDQPLWPLFALPLDEAVRPGIPTSRGAQ